MNAEGGLLGASATEGGCRLLGTCAQRAGRCFSVSVLTLPNSLGGLQNCFWPLLPTHLASWLLGVPFCFLGFFLWLVGSSLPGLEQSHHGWVSGSSLVTLIFPFLFIPHIAQC